MAARVNLACVHVMSWRAVPSAESRGYLSKMMGASLSLGLVQNTLRIRAILFSGHMLPIYLLVRGAYAN